MRIWRLFALTLGGFVGFALGAAVAMYGWEWATNPAKENFGGAFAALLGGPVGMLAGILLTGLVFHRVSCAPSASTHNQQVAEQAAPESSLYRLARLLCASGYALFGGGFLLWFFGLAAGLGGAGKAAEVVFLSGLLVGGLGAVAALSSVVLAAWGWCKTGRLYPWWILIALGIGFFMLVGIFYWLYLA